MRARLYRSISVVAALVGALIAVAIGAGASQQRPWAHAWGVLTLVVQGHRVWCDWDPAEKTLGVRGRITTSVVPDDAGDDDRFDEVIITEADGSVVGTEVLPRPPSLRYEQQYSTYACVVPLDAPLRCQRALYAAAADRDWHLVPEMRFYPSGGRQAVFSLWTPLVLLLSVAALARALGRRKCPGCCHKCGYDLTGNVSGICPECGTPVPPSAGSKPKESS